MNVCHVSRCVILCCCACVGGHARCWLGSVHNWDRSRPEQVLAYGCVRGRTGVAPVAPAAFEVSFLDGIEVDYNVVQCFCEVYQRNIQSLSGSLLLDICGVITIIINFQFFCTPSL